MPNENNPIDEPASQEPAAPARRQRTRRVATSGVTTPTASREPVVSTPAGAGDAAGGASETPDSTSAASGQTADAPAEAPRRRRRATSAGTTVAADADAADPVSPDAPRADAAPAESADAAAAEPTTKDGGRSRTARSGKAGSTTKTTTRSTKAARTDGDSVPAESSASPTETSAEADRAGATAESADKPARTRGGRSARGRAADVAPDEPTDVAQTGSEQTQTEQVEPERTGTRRSGTAKSGARKTRTDKTRTETARTDNARTEQTDDGPSTADTAAEDSGRLDVFAELGNRPVATPPAREGGDSPRLATTALLFQPPDPTNRPRRRRAQAPAGPPKFEDEVTTLEHAVDQAEDDEAAEGSAAQAAAEADDAQGRQGADTGADADRDDRDDSDEDDRDDSDEDDGNDNQDDDQDDQDDDNDNQDGAPRRRRRRGGRGRRSRSGSGDRSGDDDSPDESPRGNGNGKSNGPRKGKADDAEADDDAADSDDTTQDEADGDSQDDSDDGSGSSSRRRRRRRRGSRGDSSGEDDNGSSGGRSRSRSGKTGSDEVTALKGSTRLEAKRQRRREGRDAGRRRTIVTESEFLARREAVDRSMIVREANGRVQIAVLEDDVLVEHFVSRSAQNGQSSTAGNVYLGRVQNVLPSMEAAFVDVGKGRNAVLYAGEVNWDAAGMEGQPRRIEQALKSGDSVLVQVTKDPIGHKGARLTSQISLAGRYLVYVPGGGMTGISRKLPENERARLKKILREVVPEAAGVIVRTAAEGASEEELRNDVERLQEQWAAIEKKAKTASAPALLQGEPDLAIRVVRDIFNDDFRSLVVQGDGAWSTISEYVGVMAPDLAAKVTRWEQDGDVFAAHRIDEQLAKGMDRKVWLPSGGSLVIDRTEAMTVVDVNTGKFTGSGGTLEETVTRNNLEAAEEIVRQLRLRDIGGIIVIDFIDMVLESNRDLVLRRLVECLGRDRTKHQVAEVTSLGLVQMTRKRVGQGLVEAFSETCQHCNGRGFLVHSEPIDAKGSSEHGDGSGSHDSGGDSKRSRRKKASSTATSTPSSVPVLPEAREAVKATLATIAAAAAHAHEQGQAEAASDRAASEGAVPEGAVTEEAAVELAEMVASVAAVEQVTDVAQGSDDSEQAERADD